MSTVAKNKRATKSTKRTKVEDLPTRIRLAVNVEAHLRIAGAARNWLAGQINSPSTAYGCFNATTGITIDVLGRIASLLECDVADLLAPLTEDNIAEARGRAQVLVETLGREVGEIKVDALGKNTRLRKSVGTEDGS